MSRGMKRSLIPEIHSDLSRWPGPDVNVFGETEREDFYKRRLAVELYANGTNFAAIKAQTGKSEDEVQRIVKRCLKIGPDGSIFGFYACIRGARLQPYTRTAVVSHVKGTGSGGCAGALTQIFERFPELEALVQELYFGRGSRHRIAETQTPVVSIHNRFKKELRAYGFTDNDWPFNTENCGYQAICSYCYQLRLADVQGAALGRSGIEAMRRGAVGTGIPPLIPCLRPFSSVQLDFHKVDAASIIILRNEFDVECEVPLSRWHIGLAVEEYSGAVIGAYIVLERTPSGDSTLEVVDSILRIGDSEVDDARQELMKQGNALLNQLVPTLVHQCFAVLKMDNGKSNIAHEVVNNIIETVGCAVNFGPVYGWWRRNLIEKIFGELTAKGLQRAPSTHGTGPGDPRISDPNGKAIKFRILLSELVSIIYRHIRAHNVEKTERLQWSSPVECINAALANPKSGLFHQPLPISVQHNMLLMQHVETATVRGSVERNERPYFKCDRWRYTNQTLANAFWLIGKKLLIYTDRRRCRIVYATVIDTGERLGLMTPSGWRSRSNCSWRDRKLLNRSGIASSHTDDFDDPMEELKEAKMAAIRKRPKTKKKHSSSDALDLARIHAARSDMPEPSGAELSSSQNFPAGMPKTSDPFGLSDVPVMTPITRRI